MPISARYFYKTPSTMGEFIFHRDNSDDPLLKRELIVNSDGPDEDIRLHISLKAPLIANVALEFALDRDDAEELHRMLGQWLTQRR